MAMEEKKVRIEVTEEGAKMLGRGVSPNPKGRAPTVRLVDDEEEDQPIIKRMLEALGGDGKVACYYQRPSTGDWSHVGSIEVDEALAEDIEGYIGKNFGGGTFRLRPMKAGKKVAPSVVVQVDERIYGPLRNKWKEQQAERADADGRPQAAPQPSGLDEIKLLTLRSEMEQRTLALQLEQSKQTQGMFMMMLKMQEDSQARLVAALSGQHGGAAQGGLGQVTEVAKFLQSMGWGPPEGAAGPSDMSPAMSILNGAVSTFTGKIAESVGGMIQKQMEPTPPPPRALPAPAPKAAVPQVQAQPAQPAPAPPVAPASKAAVDLPPGVKMREPKAPPVKP